MSFEWDLKKSIANKEKHGIDFETAKILWSDDNRVEIHASYPVEDRWILIGKKDNKLWTAIFTLRETFAQLASGHCEAHVRRGNLFDNQCFMRLLRRPQASSQ